MRQPHDEIRRRPDGSIDTAHYSMIGRRRRADQARWLFRQVTLRCDQRR
ncbi:hypothetical protein [Roseitranquillus sediminis]|nr:hypothetical protein [Roseitranquillus sediminis]MBM9593211.1 hypothetical protein [Roseitranquillus sediminis]